MLLERLGKELLYFDGGMGTLLQREGLQPGELPEVWNMERGDVIRNIHKDYFKAGSDIVLTNTFGANSIKFHSDVYSLQEVVENAVRNGITPKEFAKQKWKEIEPLFEREREEENIRLLMDYLNMRGEE